MTDKKVKLILSNGESYIGPLVKAVSGRPPKLPYEYSEARTNALGWISNIENEMKSIDKDKIIAQSFIFGLSMSESFFAKSHFPDSIIRESKAEFVGSRQIAEANSKQKFIYARGDLESLKRLKENLNKSEKILTKSWIEDVRKLEGISFFKHELAFEGFEKTWQEGRVELVLHPMGDHSQLAEEALLKILRKTKVNLAKLQITNYGKNELKFVSVYLNRTQLDALKGFNPLRTVHPMGGYRIPDLRSMKGGLKHPFVSESASRSTVKVGMFDGGVDDKHPLLKNHVKENVLTKSTQKEIQKYIAHGNSVAGVMLYGDLANYNEGAKLPPPKVFVESFRVLPLRDEKDLDLHEVIDHIEEVVASREDIKIYNVSFGPYGPIYKDNITRFTYALDRLAHEYKVLFIVAVGNDGEEASPFNRIQAPADIINGIGVGAFSYKRKSNERIRAPYSCIGPGREGAQTKPDLVAFGGCRNVPMHLIGHDYLVRYLDAGTSFSTPLVSSLASELIGRCNQIKPLTARVLLSHTASHPNLKPCIELGNGFAPESVEEIIECSEDSYTVLFQSSLLPGKFAKLPIPLPNLGKSSGKVEIKWTVGILSRPDLKNSEEYSNVSVEDVFYPHSDKFKFTKRTIVPGGKEKISTKILNIISDQAKMKGIVLEGYKQASLPDSDGADSLYLTEAERKAELKWDSTFTKTTTKMIKSLKEPFLSIHALERNLLVDSLDLVHYAVSVTVKITNFDGDLYSEVQRLYSKLNPIDVRSLNEVLVTVR